jgi:hypothetical protein
VSVDARHLLAWATETFPPWGEHHLLLKEGRLFLQMRWIHPSIKEKDLPGWETSTSSSTCVGTFGAAPRSLDLCLDVTDLEGDGYQSVADAIIDARRRAVAEWDARSAT